MTFNLEEFEAYLKIDKSSLDEALQQQASLYYEVANAYTEVSAERDALKERLAVTDAELDGTIREELESSGEKSTEAIVKNRIQCHRKHEAAFTAYLKAKTQAEKLQAMKEAFKARGFAIRDLCDLHTTGYFEQQSIKGDATSDRYVYNQRRERLAEGRAKRG